MYFMYSENYCSKWAGKCRYTVPELLVLEFRTGTYQFVLNIYYILIFLYVERDILVSLLRSLTALVNFHFEHCRMPTFET
jgi:hypothetical protein